MAKEPTCLVCQKVMVKGFITETTNGLAFNLPRWCEGEPRSSMWTGGDSDSAQQAKSLKVLAYRCPECEALRLYAPSRGG